MYWRHQMKNRIWEIDFIRGLLIIAVVVDHFFFDCIDVPKLFGDFYTASPEWILSMAKVANIYWYHAARTIIRTICIGLFFLLSGISCTFSHKNARRGLKLVIFGAIISLITYVLYFTNVMDERIVMGVITCFGLSILIYAGLDKLLDIWKVSYQFKKYIYLGIGISLVIWSIAWHLYPENQVAGLTEWNFNTFFLFLFGKLRYGRGDYFGLLPHLSYIFLGAFIGMSLYKDRVSVFPKLQDNLFIRKINWVGRKTLWIYFGSQIVLYPLVVLITYIGGARF